MEEKAPSRLARGGSRRSRPLERDPAATRAALLEAARVAFLTDGYEQTDTNRIARAAGFAPQTFYRHFADKLAAFQAVYRAWIAEGIGPVLAEHRPSVAARRLVAEHERMRVFRRSLRHLAIVEPAVRRARAEERAAQLAALRASQPGAASLADGALLAWLLSVERWVDAMIEGELEDLGLSRAAAMRELVALLVRMTVTGAGSPV